MNKIDIHKEIRERLKGPDEVITVDATPDEDYPVRILEAYIKRTECKWMVHGCTDGLRQIYDAMNEAQDKRAEILREAIAHLKRNK